MELNLTPRRNESSRQCALTRLEELPAAVKSSCLTILSKYGEFDSFDNQFAPDKGAMFVSQYGAEKMIASKVAPTLTYIKLCYSDECAVTMVAKHLLDCARYLGQTNAKIEQMTDIAYVLMDKAHDLKITELMLFFHKLKRGDFRDDQNNDMAKMYGAFNGLVIMDCLSKFREYRACVIDRIEREERAEKMRSRNDDAASPEERRRIITENARNNPLLLSVAESNGWISKEEANEIRKLNQQNDGKK